MKLFNLLMFDDINSLKDRQEELFSIIPEIKYMVGFLQKNPNHHLDVWNHTLLALSLSEKDFDIRLCLLLHDIGKPFCYQEGKIRHFHNHANVSSFMSEEILKRFNFPIDYINYISYLIKYHDTPISEELIKSNYDLALKLYKIQYCDALAHHPDKLEKRKEYLDKTKILLKK